eukprot:CAMPEP_0172437128 /NCGR_PEP_ID=MMETSP1064-20121228/72088_1 /TAXON_ID=202472 /ORGANISM="Aulacoseira subarctica , Strain CCAP 1002/5" /LENGTH=546 /DNA_ID=CAMNT_0013185573 /DNA_START=136 /DNA_END=1776 /DNA_ORIENTATION=-
MKKEQQSISIVTQAIQETIQDIDTDARVIENEDVTTLRSDAAKKAADSLCDQGLSSEIGTAVRTGIAEEQTMLDHKYKFLLPDTLSREEKMVLESALKNTDWNKILREYKNLKSTSEESSVDDHDNSLFVSPLQDIDDNDTWMVNSDELDDTEHNMKIADEVSDEELYDVTGTGGEALSFLLAQVSKGVKSENLVDDGELYLEESIASVYQLSFSGDSSESLNDYSIDFKKNKGFGLSSKSHLQKSAKLSKRSHPQKACSRNNAPLKGECGDHSVDESSIDISIGRKALESLLMTTKNGRKNKPTALQLPLDDAFGGSPRSYLKGKKSAKKSQISSKNHYIKAKNMKTDDSSVITDAGRKALQALLSNITNKTTSGTSPSDVDAFNDTTAYEATNESSEKLETDRIDLTSTSTGVSIGAFRTDSQRTSKISVLSTPTKLRAATSPYNTRRRARMEAAEAHPVSFETRTSKVNAKKHKKIIPNDADQSKKKLNEDDSSTVTGLGGAALGALLLTVRRGDDTSSTSSEDDSCTATIPFSGAGRRAKKR